jgi:hypothetical protein
VRLFHYHLAAADEREVEALYLVRDFELVARYGRVGREQVSFDAERSWDELDRLGFRLRLLQLERDGVEVVVQPGRWAPPRVDHVGVLLMDDEFDAVLRRAGEQRLAVQERGGRRTFVSTGAGLRLEIRRDPGGDVARLALELESVDPVVQAAALASPLGLQASAGRVSIGSSTIEFVSGGPSGRPQFLADGLPGAP